MGTQIEREIEGATYRCYRELLACDKTHTSILTRAQSCYFVRRRENEFVLEPNIEQLAMHIEDLLMGVFEWESLTERSYSILRRIGDIRDVNFYELAEHYFEHEVLITIPRNVVEPAMEVA